MRVFFLLIVLAFSLMASESTDYFNKRKPTIEYASDRFSLSETDYFILISVERQELFLSKGGFLIKTYPISTSKNGEGNKENSFKTPLGFHRIVLKSGRDAKEGTVFRGLSPSSYVVPIYKDKKKGRDDLVLTRILRLEGLEDKRNRGGNVDSHNRNIFIHGTQEEGFLGSKASHGCIRMGNSEIIDLYNTIKSGTLVYIGY